MDGIGQVTRAMVRYYAGDARRVNHFLKVYGFAKAIGELEGLDERTQTILEIAALTHDIGIQNSEKKYGSSAGAHQQAEGPPEAKALLGGLSIDPDVVERVCWLIAHHHTYRISAGSIIRSSWRRIFSSTRTRTAWEERDRDRPDEAFPNRNRKGVSGRAVV